jgi:hypothetical protein
VTVIAGSVADLGHADRGADTGQSPGSRLP